MTWADDRYPDDPAPRARRVHNQIKPVAVSVSADTGGLHRLLGQLARQRHVSDHIPFLNMDEMRGHPTISAKDIVSRQVVAKLDFSKPQHIRTKRTCIGGGGDEGIRTLETVSRLLP